MNAPVAPSREAAISHALQHFDDGTFRADLARRIAYPTESQNPERAADLRRYLTDDLTPAFEAMGFTCRILEEPRSKGPYLFAERHEGDDLPTVLGYGHGDTVRGLDAGWHEGLRPWELTERDGRWYGRGIADNKGQHSVNMAAQAAVIATRGRLGFNAKWLIETGEETGSPGLRELCTRYRDLFRADVLIGSDGPRPDQRRPTVYLGTRGGASIDVSIDAREGGHHSGNWGGLLSSPAIQLVHALSTVTSPTGQVLIPEWLPRGGLPDNVRAALRGLDLDMGEGSPAIEPNWGEPGFTGPEKVFGWCSFEILAMESGNPAGPVNAVPPRAWARVQLRFVVGVDPADIIPALRRHFERAGFPMVQVEAARDETFPATRLDPDSPWVGWCLESMRRTTGGNPLLLPNAGGSLPNDAFSDILGLPTLWVPHSYNGCSQHAPNEHLPPALLREALAVMTGLYWDLPDGARASLPA